MQLLASDETLEVRLRFAVVANLSGRGAILDVWQVRHCVANSDGPQGSRGESSDIGLDLQRVKKTDQPDIVDLFGRDILIFVIFSKAA